MPDRAARLHRARRDPIVDQWQSHAMRSSGEGLFAGGCVAHPQRKAYVGRYRIPNAWRTCGDRARQVGHARERFIVDLDQLRGVARLLQAFLRCKTLLVADVPNLVLCKEWAYRSIRFRASGVLRHEERRQTAETAMGDIVAGENT